MKITFKDSPKKRASYLRRKIVRLIKTGEFTPNRSYLCDIYGPCGCAIAAVAYIAGDNRIQANTTFREGILELAMNKSIATKNEMRILEKAYEGMYCDVRDQDSEFYKLGQYLQAFHPSYVFLF